MHCIGKRNSTNKGRGALISMYAHSCYGAPPSTVSTLPAPTEVLLMLTIEINIQVLTYCRISKVDIAKCIVSCVVREDLKL